MQRCQRQLVFSHLMASHNARDPQRREAYLLKQLQHLSAWQGSVVHKVLATDFLATLREGRVLDPGALTTAAQELAQRQFLFSMAKRYREPAQSKSAAGTEYCALFEHEYGWEVSPEMLGEVHTNLARCFHNLTTQEELLARLSAGVRYEAEVRVSFLLDDITVGAVLDLALLSKDRHLIVVDWKVGEKTSNDYSRQLLLYALAVMRCGRWPGALPETIELYEVNLLKNEVRRHPVTQERIDETEDFVYRSLVALKALIGDGKFDELDLAEFDVAGRPQTCFHCNFGPLCIGLLNSEGRSTEAAMVQGRLW